MDKTSKNINMMLLSGSVAIAAAALSALIFFHRPLSADGDPVLGGPQLVMFEMDDCSACEDFRKRLARKYAESEAANSAPLRYLSIDDGPPPRRYRLSKSVDYPMFVFFDPYGRELARLNIPKTLEPVTSTVMRNLRYVPKPQ